MHSKDRSRLTFKVRYAARHPGRLVPHARRLARDAVLRFKTGDHVSYYRAVMKSDAARSDEGAVGSHTHESWLKIGQMQFDYLVSHGLKPGMRMLEIGCGNLRAGRLFIDHLNAGDYYGIDISPDILLAAQRTVAEIDLQDKLPYLAVVRDLKLAFLPADYFDVVHAHSVFSHSPIDVIEECLAHVGRVMKPGGFFDFTFDRTEGAEHHVLREDFYYRTETLVALADRHGLTGQFMADWEELPHQQSKLRVTRRPELPRAGPSRSPAAWKDGAVTWKAPEVERSEGPLTGAERPMLQAFLDWQRETLLHKCAGLTGEQLAERSVPPSGLSLLGLVRHMTKVERAWFRQRFAGESVGNPFGEDKDADFERLDPARAAADYARLTEEFKLADAAVAHASLEDTFVHNGETMSLRMIYLHMIEEYARHLGHADLLREQIDGATGE
jgi:SAM-dependent methyltransferase